MGLFTYTVAGGGFILIGAWESLISGSLNLNQDSIFSSLTTFISILIFSFLFIINSLLSFFDAINVNDKIGSVLQLQVISISLLFLLYSILGLIIIKKSNLLPSKILNLISIFAFVEEFLLFYLQRKDPSGIENRYYDMFLVPVTICAFCSILELKDQKLVIYAKLGRGVGLILKGTWFLQMGFSFFSDLIAQGCYLNEKSRGNYTVKCKGHPEYHRGRALATLQFNCHLALLVAVIAFVYSIMCKKRGIRREQHMAYRPIGAEMQHLEMGSHAHFTLDSDEDVDGNGIKEERNVEMQKAIVAVPELETNGYHNQS